MISDEQQRSLRDRAHAHSLAAAPTFIAREAGPVLCPDLGDKLKRALRSVETHGESDPLTT